MIELRGKYNTAKIYTDNVDNATIGQVTALLNQQSIQGSNIRIMPDCHAGAGCVIGTTMTITDKVIPNLVGVDIGCLDSETQVLTQDGWIYIKDYNNQKILMYDKTTDTAFFEEPNAYIVNKADKWYHLHNKYGLDQMISPEHKVLIWKGSKQRGYNPTDYTAEDMVVKHESLARGIAGGIKTTFNIDTNGLDIKDIDIRINVMISADGCIRDNGIVEMHLKKDRKINRCITLLKENNIDFKIDNNKDGSTVVYFKNEGYSKSLKKFWKANKRQLGIICDECVMWDGTVESDRKCFSTTIKEHADIVQFAFACNGVRCGIHKVDGNKYSDNWSDWYQVYTTNNEIVGLPDYRYNAYIDRIQPKEGELKYCFNTNTGYFIIRRNNKISITGNCGMSTTKLNTKRIELPKIDSVINKNIPSGFSIRDKEHKYCNSIDLSMLKCAKAINLDRAYKSIGTLGGGNHFIEVDTDANGNLYLVIHTGSRNLGKQIAEFYQDMAWKNIKNGTKEREQYIQNTIKQLTAQGRQNEIEVQIKLIKDRLANVPKELAYCDGELFNSYIHDMRIAQEYAHLNRLAIADTILKEMKIKPIEQFETIHNYIDINNMILRKGAVSAQLGEKFIVPINMRDGSLICIGKGNTDWNCSGPHGAGRILSRSQAKQSLTVSEFKKTMKQAGIYSTSVNSSTLDESPMAYKPIDEIINNIAPTAEIVAIIKPIYNFKASEK